MVRSFMELAVAVLLRTSAVVSIAGAANAFDVDPPYEMILKSQYYGVSGACPFDMDVFSIDAGIRDRDPGKVQRYIVENGCTGLLDGSTVKVLRAEMMLALVRITFAVNDDYDYASETYWMDMNNLTNWLGQSGAEVYRGMKRAFDNRVAGCEGRLSRLNQ